MSANQRLVQFLNEGRDWEKDATSIPGIFLLRLPKLKLAAPSLAIEINPVGESGSPTKKRGVVRSSSELEEITKLF
jgi:hypothetical protein